MNQLNKYQSFIFEGYNYNFENTSESLLISMNYSLDGVEYFEEKLTFQISIKNWFGIDQAALEKALDALYLAGGVSYYKAYCPAKIVQNVVPMDHFQAAFWSKFYERGLGEFFYQNKIDFRGLIKFEANELETRKVMKGNLKERALLPLGGGKDSIVSAEILKEKDLDFLTFSLRDAEPIRATAEIIGKPRIIVDRQIAPRLIELNALGALNGHVPITGYISFVLALAAIIYNYKYIILSLEKSANFGQLNYLGMDINHQYSKSEGFEGDFRNYVKNYVCPDIEYFSLLRGFYEIRIVEIFAGLENLDKYWTKFSSCNGNFKLIKKTVAPKWCGTCPKCAFVYLCLAPFVKLNKLVEIFGENLLDNEGLLNMYEELTGVLNFKPFECVGTIEECRVAIWKLSTMDEFKDNLVVKTLSTKYLAKWGDQKKVWGKIRQIQPGHFIPHFLIDTLNNLPNAD